MTTAPLVVLGFGHLGEAVAALTVGSRPVYATTRRAEFADEIARQGVNPIVISGAGTNIPHGADVVVTFPPDGTSDELLAAQCSGARRIAYVSTTGVYGPNATTVNETTAVDEHDARAKPRLAAEAAWRARGAIVLRPPAIYGPKSGLHLRIARGDFRMVEGGGSYVSRIHVDDLAALCLAAVTRGEPGTTFVVGDLEPATQVAVCEYVSRELGVAMPESVARGDAPASLRANRRVDGSFATRMLGVTLRYPTFREGLTQAMHAAGLTKGVT
jgi:nucleoside-diphosphate-sugar epimerase